MKNLQHYHHSGCFHPKDGSAKKLRGVHTGVDLVPFNIKNMCICPNKNINVAEDFFVVVVDKMKYIYSMN